jgi:hypothetical protein
MSICIMYHMCMNVINTIYNTIEQNVYIHCAHQVNHHYRNPRLCRVPFVGHLAKNGLPSAALGKVRRSAKSPFTEC